MAGTTTCAACGAQASGNFCNHCGAPLGPASCPRCQAPLRRGARFCASCGAASPLVSASGGTTRTPWTIAAVAGVALLGLILFMVIRKEPGAQAQSPAAPFVGAAGSGTPPDLSTMTPRERFDRLYNRIMAAAESGDQATVAQFTPMAISAYNMLDTVDVDARYHLALLKVHTGDMDAVSAVADTILATSPGHLFGYMIRGAVARFRGDDAAKKKAYSDFLAHYEAELGAERQEYTDHQRAVDEFLKAAREGT